MRAFYPPIEPYESGMLDVGDGHHVYWEVSGNPDGKPAVVLHGGPGSGTVGTHRQHFDPDRYRIVLFDQRGAGKSTPHVSDPEHDLDTNTTWHLVADMEQLREHLRIEKWQLFGGSWGATLALAYAQKHPDRVTEIILRGVFTLRQSELDWLYQGGAAHLFPDAWDKFVEPIPEHERDDMLRAYHKLVFHDDPKTSLRSAMAWSLWEGATASTQPNPVNSYGDEKFAVAFARIAVHYFVNKGWLEEGQLIRDAGKLKGIPGVIINGRYDVVTPLITAYDLAKAWPGSVGTVLNAAGHAVADPGVAQQLLAATDKFAN
ncbi:proline iminopeptidase [Kibdelosporangium banguiense]|uniref:Proline iminopeptidase n=1 Tax=Kibdelosporangium banguiense TaxID=1365924 RepID=A0ABS4T852_9PSEU|nr:prolyl aminopeptidase [Kibdelosporangium banguiense]MBP2320607.1 proline iminopeptidase [Kibdelosporangium banguiense]